MANVQYSGVRESRPGRVNDLGTTGKEVEENYKKGCLKMSQVLENPRGGCVLAGINSVLGAIHKVCPVYHSGPGCCMQTTAADQGYEVYPIETPGFAGDSNLGYETIWNTMIDKVIEKDVPKNDKLVNIFGIVPYHDPFWSGTLEEIDRILSRLGLTVNTFFIKDQGIETIKKCSGAALNIIINSWLFKGPARKFEQKFGVPSIRIPGLPIGATDTTAFVRAVAEALNLDQALVDSVIESEEAYVYNYLANDFSFTPVLVVISEPMFRQEDKDRILAQIENLEYAVPPKVIFTADQYEVNQAILNEKKEITLILGSSNDREVALTKDCQFILTSFPMNERLVFNRTYAGYRGSLTFTEDLYDNL